MDSKSIHIVGTNNRYMMNKLIKDHREKKESKKRVVAEKWTFSDDEFTYENQIKILNNISNNTHDNVSKIAIQEINKKISSYKQQDIIKNHYDQEKFLCFETVIQKLNNSNLKCYYCDCKMNIIYDISREMTQWSVDRIDNDLGHNNDNFHVACLDCNLKRRRRTDEKFLFTKQLNIIKKDNAEIN